MKREISEISWNGSNSSREKIKFIQKILRKEDFDALIITHLPDIFYLCSFTGSSGTVIITRNKAFFFSDFRYKTQANKEVSKDFEIFIYKKWEDLFGYVFKNKKRVKLCFDKKNISYFDYLRIKSINKSFKVIPYRPIVSEMRIVKTEEEKELVKKAQRKAEQVLRKVLSLLKPGKTKERDLALEIEYLLKKEGFGISFPIIVASGSHSALPHAKPRNVVIKNNVPLLIDMGAIYKGYSSDMTRTFWIGRNVPDWFSNIYHIVLEAVERVEERVEAGMLCNEVDNIARGYIKEKGYGDKFGHGLGHGVGIEIHELPYIAPSVKDPLKKGTIFTIEPGIYIEKRGGVRIEDMCYINKNGKPEILTSFTKKLLKL